MHNSPRIQTTLMLEYAIKGGSKVIILSWMSSNCQLLISSISAKNKGPDRLSFPLECDSIYSLQALFVMATALSAE